MPRRLTPPARRPAPRLWCEELEAREVPAVSLRTIFDPAAVTLGANQISSDKPTFLPVTVTNTPAGAVTTSVVSNTAGVTAEVVQGGRSVRFDLTGTDQNGAPFSGSITIRLFENVAPLASQRIVDLVNSGFYSGKVFHRITDLLGGTGENVIIQGGSPNGDGQGGSALPDLPDEYNRDYTFASDGLVAYANAGDDNNDSQFFFTDVGRPLADRIQFLNFNHTIFGIVTDGFDTLAKVRNTTTSGSTPVNPVTIVGAAVFTDTENAVIKLTPQNGFTGAASVTVTANDGTGPTTQAVNVVSQADGVDSKPFITTPIPNQTTTAGTAVSFPVATTDQDGDPVTVVIRGTARDTNGNLLFTGAPVNVTATYNAATGQVTVTPNAGFTGTAEFAVGVRQTSAADSTANYDTQLVRLTVNPAPTTTDPGTPTSPAAPNTGPVTAEGSAAGTSPVVTIRNADGSVRFSVPVFEPGFLGGVRVAVADTDQDGDQDVIATAGMGGAPVVLRIDPATGQVVQRVMVYEDTFRGGLYLKLKDVAGLGYAQVLVGAGETGGPRVTLLDLKRNVVLQNFFAGDSNLRGGVTVDAGRVFEDRGQTIVTGLGPGAGPVVAFFDPNTGASLGTFTAGDASGRAGIRVEAGTANATTGVQPVVVAPLTAPDGSGGQSYNADDVVVSPTTTTGTGTGSSTGGGSNISDFENLRGLFG